MAPRHSPRGIDSEAASTARPTPRLGLALVILAIGAIQPFAACGAGEGAADARSVPTSLPGAPPFPQELRSRLASELEARGSGYEPRTRNRRADGSPAYSNRLLLEASPYLQQHAHNPVNWYPWGDEAFDAARALGRPVLVSIGYSTCHWCHVMEEESFDDPETARYLNEHFIAIKVDRETRPDIDQVYMTAIQALTGHGGWPLNVWLTPERKPFYGGTYFPPEDRGGRPGFRSVLRMIHEQYQEQPERFLEYAERLTAVIRAELQANRAESTRMPGSGPLERAKSIYASAVDRTWGGVGERTKFPATVPIRFLLRYYRRTGDTEALELAALTLEKMAAGGMYDLVGGGFHRYSTDPQWLVPHFEKMLYDNALLTLAYLEAWQVTGREDFARVAREILDYVMREMTSSEGGFYSATDADSRSPEGELEEGRFFTWTPAEVEAAVGAERAPLVLAYSGVTADGNFEKRNVLRAARPPEVFAREHGLALEELRTAIDEARARLYEVRQTRLAPLRDEKILAGWNGLMISAFARAGFAFDEDRYNQTAIRSAEFVLGRMRADGRLRRFYQGGRAAGPAFLEDYAFLIAGLLDLYEADPDPRWIREAVALQSVLDAHYLDAAGGGYFKTADDEERLLAREKPRRDGAVPSGNSVAALNLLRLYEFTLDARHLESATQLFSAFYETLERDPARVAEMLLALDYELDAVKEVVVVGPESGGDLAPMLAPLRAAFLPNRILAVVSEGAELAAHAAVVPLVARKVARDGRVTAYVCVDRVCDLPTSDPGVVAEQIAEIEPLE
jgi:uncharacterized protein YyaL (SSP411 family)